MWPPEVWLRKHIAWLIIFVLFLFAALALGATDIIFGALNRPPFNKSALLAGIVICVAISLFAGTVFYALAIAPTRRHVSLHCGRVCKNCLFVLTSLPNRGKCPECGREYDIDETIKSWHDTFDAPEKL